MRHSEIDKRSKRNAPKQCVADHGMHKDATTFIITTAHPPSKVSIDRRVWPVVAFTRWPDLCDDVMRRRTERDRDE
jgi:hypothetical protein